VIVGRSSWSYGAAKPCWVVSGSIDAGEQLHQPSGFGFHLLSFSFGRRHHGVQIWLLSDLSQQDAIVLGRTREHESRFVG
jgi:hypothetical protein